MKEKFKVVELFGGIGATHQGLLDIGMKHEIVKYVDFDKFVVKSYNAIYDTNWEPSDIREIKSLPKCDLLTYSFPCQDISVAGHLKGFNKGHGTRSGLLWEVERLLIDYYDRGELPKYLIMENVKNLISKRFIGTFEKWLDVLEIYGYNTYYQVLNAKDYEIPQNRARVFAVSILKEHDLGHFTFPEKKELKLRLYDMLEYDVPEKYYLTLNQIEKFVHSSYHMQRDKVQKGDICNTLCARDYKDSLCVKMGEMIGGKWDKLHEQSRRIYSSLGISPTLTTVAGGNHEIKIFDAFAFAMRGRNVDDPASRKPGIELEQRIEINPSNTSNTLATVNKDNYLLPLGGEGLPIKENTKQGYVIANEGDYINIQFASSKTRRGVVGKGISQTLTCNDSNAVYVDGWIRKLTPLEYWRLTGRTDEDYHNAARVNSASQLYKQAGNSIVVPVMSNIFEQLLWLEKLESEVDEIE